ncbi:MAG: PadR family transcriptional regulator [Acidobacteria bacterium]|nr:MAG: PadR family transcriptional regulator [Acidobacteriota bacterium]
MPPRSSLGELELVILLGLMRAGEGAYGAAIREEIAATTGRDVTPGAIYPTLDRLEQRGLVRSYMGEPTGERGGRARRHFVLLKPGLAEVRRAWRQYATLASGLEAALGKGRGQ